ncbi:hypothetical protein CEXT_676131 [Caerostris extrusa]|uniref:Uncharacterized protein n=1 Tax=Caerostris extrusa TaxID=172846 RepID=A0AAV4WNS8_CAEEX|nr:hypothetical protein CEXT_676131 [Caerostris extrusa]
MNTNSCVELVYKLQFPELVTTSSQIAHRHYLALLFKAQSMITNRLRSHTDQRDGDQECPADQLKTKSGKSSGVAPAGAKTTSPSLLIMQHSRPSVRRQRLSLPLPFQSAQRPAYYTRERLFINNPKSIKGPSTIYGYRRGSPNYSGTDQCPLRRKGDSIPSPYPLQPAFPLLVSSVVSLCCVSARERERYRFKALAKSRALSCVQGRRGVKGVGREGRDRGFDCKTKLRGISKPRILSATDPPPCLSCAKCGHRTNDMVPAICQVTRGFRIRKGEDARNFINC